jgi:hypothetical protein
VKEETKSEKEGRKLVWTELEKKKKKDDDNPDDVSTDLLDNLCVRHTLRQLAL